jgi:hypothetical protein
MMMSFSVDSLFKKYLHCLIFLWFSGVILLSGSYSLADESLPDGNTGELSIESKTTLYSADCYIKGEENEDDKKRTSIGIGESFTLTLTGKPMGDIEELTWEFVSGKELVKESEEDKFKGKKKITLTARKDLTPDQLKNQSSIELKVTTSEGRTVTMRDPMSVFFPTGMTATHRGVGTPEVGCNNRGATQPSAQLVVTLQPTHVSFKNIKIIERDLGSDPNNPRKTLDVGHTDHGVDDVIDIDKANRFVDHLRGTVAHQDIQRKIHILPQDWKWKCSWRVHKGEGGPIKISGNDDVGQIGEIVEQSFKFYYQFNPQTQRVSAVCGEVSKFGCTAQAYSDGTGNHYNYLGPKETD